MSSFDHKFVSDPGEIETGAKIIVFFNDKGYLGAHVEAPTFPVFLVLKLYKLPCTNDT